MAIFVLKSANTAAVLEFAQTLRNAQVNKKQGALLVTADGEPRHQLEKIIDAVALPASGEPVPANEVPWKSNSIVIVPAPLLSKLDDFEALVPGFKALFGPLQSIDVPA